MWRPHRPLLHLVIPKIDRSRLTLRPVSHAREVLVLRSVYTVDPEFPKIRRKLPFDPKSMLGLDCRRFVTAVSHRRQKLEASYLASDGFGSTEPQPRNHLFNKIVSGEILGVY